MKMAYAMREKSRDKERNEPECAACLELTESDSNHRGTQVLA